MMESLLDGLYLGDIRQAQNFELLQELVSEDYRNFVLGNPAHRSSC
jgi:hypothetical protein